MNTDKIVFDRVQQYMLIHIIFVLSAFSVGYLDILTRGK